MVTASTYLPSGGDWSQYTRTSTSSNLTVSTPQQIVGCTAHSITITLGSAMVADGEWVIVNDESGGAGGVGQAITVDTEGSETIDGSSSVSIDTNFEGTWFYSDGTNWFSLTPTTAI